MDDSLTIALVSVATAGLMTVLTSLWAAVRMRRIRKEEEKEATLKRELQTKLKGESELRLKDEIQAIEISRTQLDEILGLLRKIEAIENEESSKISNLSDDVRKQINKDKSIRDQKA